MLAINSHTNIPLSEIDLSAIRAQGPGGQNVNKVNSAVHLRFDVRASSLNDAQKQKVLAIHDTRLTAEGVIVIKAQSARTQARNKDEALRRLAALLRDALKPVKKRRPTKPSYGAIKRRLKKKTERSQTKNLRKKPSRDD